MALLTQIYSTTRTNRDRPLADVVTTNHPFLKMLDEGGNIINANGGRDLTEPLLYQELDSATVKWYDGYETFTVNTATEQVTAAVYNWKQLGGFSFISGKEEHMNTGKQAAVDLLDAKDQGLIATMKNKAGAAVYSDGTGTSGKEWGGLLLLVADVPSAVSSPGGIDQVANVWWRNQADVAAVAITSATILGRMNNMYLATLRDTEAVDLIPSGLTPFKGYWEALQSIQRLTEIKKGAAGYKTLEYMGAPVFYDTLCRAKYMYFLQTKYFKMRKAPGRWFTEEEPQRIQGADYTLFPCWVMSNLTCNNRARQGVIGDSTP